LERAFVYRRVLSDQARVGLGCAGFDVEDLGWTTADADDDFDGQKAFVLGVVGGALAHEGWERLPFVPLQAEIIGDLLRELRTLVELFPREAIGGAPASQELPVHGRCPVHDVDLYELSGARVCIICNHAPIDAPPETTPHRFLG
jgi:hypothetical protein